MQRLTLSEQKAFSAGSLTVLIGSLITFAVVGTNIGIQISNTIRKNKLEDRIYRSNLQKISEQEEIRANQEHYQTIVNDYLLV